MKKEYIGDRTFVEVNGETIILSKEVGQGDLPATVEIILTPAQQGELVGVLRKIWDCYGV